MYRPIIPLLHPINPPFNADAEYTVTLQQVCEVLTDKYGVRFDQLSDAARAVLFNFDYEFWSENEDMKREFETDFLRHFFMREIGYETVALFRLKLEDVFKVWMPYYSNLARAAIRAAELDWTLTDDYWIDYYSDSTTDRNITDNNETVNSGSDTRTSNQTGENTGNLNDTRQSDQNGHESQHDNDQRTNSQTTKGDTTTNDTRKSDQNGHESQHGTDQRTNSQTAKGDTTTNDTRTIDQTGERHGTNSNNRTHGGSDTTVSSGSVSHSYDKAIVNTDTPQDRFTQGGSGQQFAVDALNVKMDYATDVTREKYKADDTDNNKQSITNYNSTINDAGKNDEDTTNHSTDTLNGKTVTNSTVNGTDTLDSTSDKFTTLNGNETLNSETETNSTVNGTDTLDSNSDKFTTLNGNETLDRKTTQNSTMTGKETLEKGTKVNYSGAKNDNHHSAVHQSTHEAGRRGVAWIDIYDKYMKAIRNIEDEIFRRFDPMLFMQIWG